MGGQGGKTAKTAVKWSKMIRFWILKCLWNHLIEMLQLGRGLEGSLFLGGWSLGAKGPPAGGLKGPPKPSTGARKRGAVGPLNFLVVENFSITFLLFIS